jgi:hypothetical protein
MASSLRPLRPLRLRAFDRKLRKASRKGRKDKTRMRQTRFPATFLPDFHSLGMALCFHSLSRPKQIWAEKWSIDQAGANGDSHTAQKALHWPVNGLHSIDLPADKTPRFLLTIKMEGVKTTSFFDSF